MMGDSPNPPSQPHAPRAVLNHWAPAPGRSHTGAAVPRQHCTPSALHAPDPAAQLHNHRLRAAFPCTGSWGTVSHGGFDDICSICPPSSQSQGSSASRSSTSGAAGAEDAAALGAGWQRLQAGALSLQHGWECRRAGSCPGRTHRTGARPLGPAGSSRRLRALTQQLRAWLQHSPRYEQGNTPGLGAADSVL